MKRLATLMLALMFAFGTVAVTFAQDEPQKAEKKAKGKGKTSKKKKTEEPKKDKSK
jgi:ribosomal protein L12E/L44/L45/RPP1/RPP2